MRIQDVLKFSLELFLPERWISAILDRAPPSDAAPNQKVAGQNDQAGEPPKARSIIQDLDHGEFGGPSFGPHTMQLMENVLDDIQAEAAAPLSDDWLRRIASAILRAAADGERDAGRLKAKAIAAVAEADPARKD